MTTTMTLVNKRLLLSDTKPTETATNAKFSQRLDLLGRSTPPEPTEDGCLYTKRFATTRDRFFTTNTDGEVLEVQDPATQFKRSVAKFENTKFARTNKRYRETKTQRVPGSRQELQPFVDEAPYCRITCLENERGRKQVIGLLSGMVNDGDMDRYLAYISTYFVQHRYIVPFALFFDSTNYPQAGYWHALTPHEWFRVRAYILNTIRLFQLDALLVDDAEAYHAYYPQEEDSFSHFSAMDDLLAYTLLRLVHFSTFKTRREEIQFYADLHSSGQRTKFLLAYFHKHACQSLDRAEVVRDAYRIVLSYKLKEDYVCRVEEERFFDENFCEPEYVEYIAQGYFCPEVEWFFVNNFSFVALNDAIKEPLEEGEEDLRSLRMECYDKLCADRSCVGGFFIAGYVVMPENKEEDEGEKDKEEDKEEEKEEDKEGEDKDKAHDEDDNDEADEDKDKQEDEVDDVTEKMALMTIKEE